MLIKPNLSLNRFFLTYPVYISLRLSLQRNFFTKHSLNLTIHLFCSLSNNLKRSIFYTYYFTQSQSIKFRCVFLLKIRPFNINHFRRDNLITSFLRFSRKKRGLNLYSLMRILDYYFQRINYSHCPSRGLI